MSTRKKFQRGRVDYVSDFYVDGRRYQLGNENDEAAQIRFETCDDRVCRDQTLIAWLRYRRAHLPKMTWTASRSHRARLKVCIEVISTMEAVRDVPLIAISGHEIGALYERMLKRSWRRRKISRVTTHQWLDALSAALDAGLAEGRVRGNAVKQWRRYKENRSPRTIKLPDVPSAKCCTAIRDRLDPDSRLGFALIARAGLTTLEVAGLSWDNVNLIDREIRVTMTYNSNRNEVCPCSASAQRQIGDLPQDLVDLLFAAIKYQGRYGNEYVLNYALKGPVASPRTMVPRRLRQAIQQAQREAGIVSRRTGKGYTTENLRDRNVVTRLNAPGANQIVVKTAAGYASINSFSLRYGDLIVPKDAHAQMELSRHAMASLSALVL